MLSCWVVCTFRTCCTILICLVCIVAGFMFLFPSFADKVKFQEQPSGIKLPTFLNYTSSIALNIAAYRLVLVLCARELPRTYLSLEAGYTRWKLHGFSQHCPSSTRSEFIRTNYCRFHNVKWPYMSLLCEQCRRKSFFGEVLLDQLIRKTTSYAC